MGELLAEFMRSNKMDGKHVVRLCLAALVLSAYQGYTERAAMRDDLANIKITQHDDHEILGKIESALLGTPHKSSPAIWSIP